jgi:hypothetical protein
MRGILGIFSRTGEVGQEKCVPLGYERPSAGELPVAGARPHREVV